MFVQTIVLAGRSDEAAMVAEELETSELDSIINVIGLSPTDPVDTFAGLALLLDVEPKWMCAEMWYQVFLWALFSSLFVHIIAAGIAFGTLRKHKLGRFTALLILVFGVLSPLTGGVITSAAIAGVYRAAHFQMMPFYALVWGVGQTFLAVVMSFTRILATL
ncbi:TMEM170B [Cordylochernes scorpioides]|uniref:TMEM170B n=1 Tax=Cordylochernes scorpioides TaxID=51811 RepID=A0ABY6KEF2_9ARAC|nr:TMEM170B [Cordylochernes scorpioides]UYV66969.1 TMEM170B [Cordylochernes scorpioides]